MMKRTICALLALLLAMGCAALAEGDDIQEFSEAGITLHLPEAYLTSRGVVTPLGGSELASGLGIYYLGLYYVAMTEDEVKALEAASEAEQAALYDAMLPLFSVIAIDRDRNFDDLKDFLGDALDDQYVREIGRAEDVTFYSYIEPMADASAYALAEEYAALYDLNGETLAAAEFYKPLDPYDAVKDSVVAFTTTDIDGNAVDSADLFASHAITMVNVWASWCGPCVGEIGELQAINDRLAEIDCAVVGLLYDGNKASALESARATLAEKGATYLNLLPPDDVDSLFPINAFPTTFFVDRDGRIVGSPIVGAGVNAYEDAVKALLG